VVNIIGTGGQDESESTLIKDYDGGLLFLSLFWGAYAISRLITIFVDGSLGTFGNQWIITETTFCVIAIGLLLASKNYNKV
jgi:hypothetical protein